MGRDLRSYEQTVEWLLAHPDGWVRACAAFSLAESDEAPARQRLHDLRTDPDARVREVAERAGGTASAQD